MRTWRFAGKPSRVECAFIFAWLGECHIIGAIRRIILPNIRSVSFIFL